MKNNISSSRIEFVKSILKYLRKDISIDTYYENNKDYIVNSIVYNIDNIIHINTTDIEKKKLIKESINQDWQVELSDEIINRLFTNTMISNKLMFNHMLRRYKLIEDTNIDCGNGKCPFINKNCEELCECGEIPNCASWFRKDLKNYYFEEVSIEDGDLFNG